MQIVDKLYYFLKGWSESLSFSHIHFDFFRPRALIGLTGK